MDILYGLACFFRSSSYSSLNRTDLEIVIGATTIRIEMSREKESMSHELVINKLRIWWKNKQHSKLKPVPFPLRTKEQIKGTAKNHSSFALATIVENLSLILLEGSKRKELKAQNYSLFSVKYKAVDFWVFLLFLLFLSVRYKPLFTYNIFVFKDSNIDTAEKP